MKSYKSLKKNFFLKFFIEKKFSFEKNSQNFSKQIQKFEKLFFFEIFCNFLSTWCFFERHTHALKDSPKIFFVKKFWSFDRNFFTLFLQKKRAFFFDQKLKKISKKSFFQTFITFCLLDEKLKFYFLKQFTKFKTWKKKRLFLFFPQNLQLKKFKES